ncbi:MAG: hypothetical protein [Caudoviricetes sp.]|nr:MAG: hypothetical protein [Caudoviricetes sp.]
MTKAIAYNKTKKKWLANIITDIPTNKSKAVFGSNEGVSLVFPSKKEAMEKTSNLVNCKNDKWDYVRYRKYNYIDHLLTLYGRSE